MTFARQEILLTINFQQLASGLCATFGFVNAWGVSHVATSRTDRIILTAAVGFPSVLRTVHSTTHVALRHVSRPFVCDVRRPLTQNSAWIGSVQVSDQLYDSFSPTHNVLVCARVHARSRFRPAV